MIFLTFLSGGYVVDREKSKGSENYLLNKLNGDPHSISKKDFIDLILALQTKYASKDIIISSLSKEIIIDNMDFFARSLYAYLNEGKNKPSGYVLNSLKIACYGLYKEERKEIFLKNKLALRGEVEFNRRYGFANFKFFSLDKNLYLFILHNFGYSSLTKHIEEIANIINRDYLQNVGFSLVEDEVIIYQKDVYEHYDQVLLNKQLEEPKWRQLNNEEKKWFLNNWYNEANPDSEISDPEFFQSGKPYDAYKKIREILRLAKHDLFIIDPYIDDQLFPLLENLKNTIKIRVLTHKTQKDSYQLAMRFQRQRGNFELRKTKKFHDRYIFTDLNCFVLGSSINSFGDKATTIIPICQEQVAKSIMDFANEQWEINK